MQYICVGFAIMRNNTVFRPRATCSIDQPGCRIALAQIHTSVILCIGPKTHISNTYHLHECTRTPFVCVYNVGYIGALFSSTSAHTSKARKSTDASDACAAPKSAFSIDSNKFAAMKQYHYIKWAFIMVKTGSMSLQYCSTPSQRSVIPCKNTLTHLVRKFA